MATILLPPMPMEAVSLSWARIAALICWARSVARSIGAGEAQVKIGLIDAGCFHHRGKLMRGPHNPAGNLCIPAVIAPDKRGGGPATAPGRFGEFPRLGNGHGRMDAVDPGRVIGGGHHAPARPPAGSAPTTRGRPFSSGWSRSSMAAKKASISRWPMMRIPCR